MRATYNITNDKLKFWPDERLPKEQYDACRKAGFQFWHGSKCFAAKWSTQAEDFILELDGTIEADDQPDDVESRVARFAGYAERAQEQAQNSQEYLETRANTERRRANAINGVERGLSEAEHWQSRIQGAISRASYREKPEVIARRVRGLESDLARYINKSTAYDPQPVCGQGPEEIWIGKGRGGYWAKRDQLPGIQAHYARWIAHAKKRIEYEMACLDAAGGCFDVLRPKRKIAVQPKGKAKARDGKALEVGGLAAFNPMFSHNPNELAWRVVMGVNRSTVDLLFVSKLTDGGFSYSRNRRSAYEIVTSQTAAECKANKPDLFEHFEKVQAILKKRKEKKAAQAQEVAA